MKHRILASSAFALFLFIGACASSDDAASGDDADITSSSHATTIQACVKTEEQGTADSDLYGVIAAHEKAEACIKKANDRAALQINKRLGDTSATKAFDALRGALPGFCEDAMSDPLPPTTSGTALQAKCKRDAEYTIALLLQLHGQLGGTTPMCAQVTKCIPRPLAMDRCLASVEAPYAWIGPLSKLDACLQTEVSTKATSYQARATAATTQKALTANQNLCTVLTRKAGLSQKEFDQNNGACRTNAASSMFNTLVTRNTQ